MSELEARQLSVPMTYLQKFAREQVLSKLSKIHTGRITISDQLGSYDFGEDSPEMTASIEVVDMDFYRRVALGGTIGGGESYFLHQWHVDNLTNLVRILVRNEDITDKVEAGLAAISAPFAKLSHWFNRNSKSGSQKNISAHYDLGNDLYKLFLDKSMMYSSAIYPKWDADLEEAAEYKLKCICEKLDLQPHHSLLEIGTGWGGMAIYAAKNYGCKITTTTISEEQFKEAKAAVERQGLSDLVTVIKQDYRDLTGEYDRLVSIEMIEAVGHQYLPTYFKCLSERLKSDGIAVLQAITIADQRYDYYLNNVDFIQKYIFPGGCLPSVHAISEQVLNQTDMVIRRIDDIGLHYAKTLQDWRNRFFDRIEHVRALGYDERFIRLWEYYLCYCEGGFLERSISTVQLVMTKPRNCSQV